MAFRIVNIFTTKNVKLSMRQNCQRFIAGSVSSHFRRLKSSSLKNSEMLSSISNWTENKRFQHAQPTSRPMFSENVDTKHRDTSFANRVDFAATKPERVVTELDFCRGEAAFKNKSSKELLRALTVLHLSSYRLIVDNSLKLMELGQLILRQRLFSRLMQATFFGHFAVTDTQDSYPMKDTIRRFESAGIHPMIFLTVEEDVGEDPGRYDEEMYNHNRDIMLKCIDLQASFCNSKSYPLMCQLKLTSYIKADLLAKMTSILQEKGLNLSNRTPLSYENCRDGLEGYLEVIPELSKADMVHLHMSLIRLNTIIQHSVSRGVKMLVDAERTNINPIMTMITLALMAKFNKQQPNIWNTYQCYLKSALDNVLQSITIAEQGGFGFGAKIVRGAYMDQERKWAQDRGTEDIVNPSWEATNVMYNKVIVYLLDYLSKNGHQKCNFIIATHNEESVQKAVQRREELGIPVTSTAVVFGQIYGMCDYISYELGKAGYHIYKSVPLGNVGDILPYLSRRAVENKTVFHRLTKEQHLIYNELKNRMLSRKQE